MTIFLSIVVTLIFIVVIFLIILLLSGLSPYELIASIAGNLFPKRSGFYFIKQQLSEHHIPTDHISDDCIRELTEVAYEQAKTMENLPNDNFWDHYQSGLQSAVTTTLKRLDGRHEQEIHSVTEPFEDQKNVLDKYDVEPVEQ